MDRLLLASPVLVAIVIPVSMATAIMEANRALVALILRSRLSRLTVLLLPGVHTCFVCKKRSEDVRRCMIPVCGKFYHGECIANYAATAPVNRSFRCSIHVCLTCFIASPGSSSVSKGQRSKGQQVTPGLPPRSHGARCSAGRLVRCVRCPVAYHATDLCMAAGSVVLSNNSIICPNHFAPRRGVKNHEHVNVSWCFVCTEGTPSL